MQILYHRLCRWYKICKLDGQLFRPAVNEKGEKSRSRKQCGGDDNGGYPLMRADTESCCDGDNDQGEQSELDLYQLFDFIIFLVWIDSGHVDISSNTMCWVR